MGVFWGDNKALTVRNSVDSTIPEKSSDTLIEQSVVLMELSWGIISSHIEVKYFNATAN